MKLISLSGFAAACYDQNTIGELIEALAGPCDTTDCAEWEIDEKEWRAAIAAALRARILRRDRLGPEI